MTESHDEVPHGDGHDGVPHGEGHDGVPHGEGHDHIVRELFRTAHGMRRYLESTLPDLPGGTAAWGVLRHLYENGPTAQADMARSIGIAGSTLTRRLEQMEDDGLIVRRDDPDDGRRIIVSLSGAGESLRLSQRARRDEEIARLTRGASTGDLKVFARVIEIIRGNLRELGIEPEVHRGFGRGRGGGHRHGRRGEEHHDGGRRGVGRRGGRA